MPFLVLFCTALWLAIEYYAFMTIAMCMVYRYVTITGTSLSERQLVAISVITFLLPLSTGIALLVSNPDFSELHSIMDKLRPEYDLQRYGNYCGFPNVKNIFIMYLIVVLCGIAIISYIVMITVGLRTRSFLAEKAEDLSAKNLQIFKMMIKALIIQALVTVLFSFPHLFLYMLLQFTSFRCLAAEYIGVLISPLVIVVDPCITLYYVLPYRRYLLRKFGFANETVSQTAMSTTAAADYIRNPVKQ
ncbi:unnamed protein product [Cylicostephanus goldi]|uniref:G-protein coupled receptors family 1 profile domain-containing protein n=1 Tax=Cylicostephanus goldi TaxID=71465 RepID=A0A3P7PSF3_CYLGO|nr:unnamed protein product [Cylicostephanus goldi]